MIVPGLSSDFARLVVFLGRLTDEATRSRVSIRSTVMDVDLNSSAWNTYGGQRLGPQLLGTSVRKMLEVRDTVARISGKMSRTGTTGPRYSDDISGPSKEKSTRYAAAILVSFFLSLSLFCVKRFGKTCNNAREIWTNGDPYF